ncbi:hypothetical protein [Actinocorallia aurantiaca]|uniref:Uncharacterized protein n=1 Tax=Actinocorallia aurantiaca TaxID=46204 RepID=A0ABP6H326_9ACTN
MAGIPLHSDGALTIVSLAAEAQVKRHVLTHRHTDLKDEFYANVRARGHIPDSERKLREKLDETTRQLQEAVARIKELEADVHGFARVINVLSLENETLRAAPRNGKLQPFPRAMGRRPGEL